VRLCECSSHGLKAFSPGSGTLLITSAVILVIPKLHYLDSLGEEGEERKMREASSGISFLHLLSVLLSPFSLPWSEREPSVPLTFQFFSAVGQAFRKQYFLLDTVICSLRAALLRMLS